VNAPPRTLAALRAALHRGLCAELLGVRDGGAYSNADKTSEQSAAIAAGAAERLPYPKAPKVPDPGTLGGEFARLVRTFVEDAFGVAAPRLRPGMWRFHHLPGETRISEFEQYAHLSELDALLATRGDLKAILGGDYVVAPDVVVARDPLNDDALNPPGAPFDPDGVARLSPLRPLDAQDRRPLLHASVSCKWTIRSDRAQNSRTEALNLLRNRRGRAPHIVVVTAEPMPSRLASVAYGLGDLDCVYHVALPELAAAVAEVGNAESKDALRVMIDGRRLRDIADLPLDLLA
jgi:hypothetical protein